MSCRNSVGICDDDFAFVEVGETPFAFFSPFVPSELFLYKTNKNGKLFNYTEGLQLIQIFEKIKVCWTHLFYP